MRRIILSGLLAALATTMAGPARAELIDRGGGLIYDTDLNITWLQDANYAVTSGVHPDGRMTWEEAVQFVTDLQYPDPIRNRVWDDWRLPSARNRDGSGPDPGYYTRSSELGHLFYTTLGNAGLYKEDEVLARRQQARRPALPRPPPLKPQAEYGLRNRGPFLNLMAAEYWAADQAMKESPKDDLYPRNAWDFFMDTGAQFYCDKWDHWYFVWPVRDGDVGPPPVEGDKPAVEAAQEPGITGAGRTAE
ncbi:MAG: hypothetical protein AB1634_19260 [Thermodesulfobacteriota bacterium]